MTRFFGWWLMALWLVPQLTAAAATPAILQPGDTRPDRGNREGTAHVTGPATPIAAAENDDLEVSFWNQPQAMTFSVAKNDVWDRRYFGNRKRLITIDDVRRVCTSGRIGRSSDLGIPDTPQALYSAYDFPCPKPVGQVIFRCPELQSHDRYSAGTGPQGMIVAEAEKGKAQGAIWGLLHRTRNLMVIGGRYADVSKPIQIQLYRHKDTSPPESSVVVIVHHQGKADYDYSKDRPDNGPLPAPEAGVDGRFFWIRQRFPGESTFPGGFEYVMMGIVDGVPCELKADSRAVGAGEKATVHPVAPEVYRKLHGWLKEERTASQRLNDAEYGALATATLPAGSGPFTLYVAVVTTRDAADPLVAAKQMLNEAQQAGAEGVVSRSTSAGEREVKAWRDSRVMHYNATSCTYADSTPWHGDYHFNEGYFLPEIVAGGAKTLEPRLRMFEEMLPALRRNAREVFHCGGICFPLVHYAIKPDRVVYGNVTWEWGIENTGFMLQPFWQIYQYTQDKEFLRRRAYPLMREAARFYADYVTKGDDGRYHVIPTVSQEHRGFTPGFKLNRDSVGALSFVKYHLRACLQASEILGVDGDQRARWREIIDQLAPYPTLPTKEGPVFCDVRDAPDLLDYNITANLVMVLWAEDISLDSPPELLEMARRSYRAIPNKEHSMRPGYLEQIRLCLGILDKPSLGPLGRVLSWPGRIHVYAGVPAGTALDDHFSGLLAVGAFEVSAAHAGTQIRHVRIKSRAGAPCKVKNPWHPAAVKVIDAETRDPVPWTVQGDTVALATQPGRSYALLGPAEFGLADQHFVPAPRTIGSWSFQRAENHQVADESGAGHHARLIGGAEVAPCQGGTALRLPGPQSYARVERTKAFDFAANESFAVEARVRVGPEARADMAPLVCSMAIRQYCLMLSGGRPKFYLSSPEGNVYSAVEARTAIADGQWHRVRGVRDVASGTLKLYVDDRLDGEAVDVTGGDFASDAPITVGAYLWGSHTRFAQGLIGTVKIESLGKLLPKQK